ncbi:hypothetical protein [Bradyrhizobium retamae]|uniref:Uncharacterized protein n=1 Tax=Bradyrhizobium retamae TaxID=1300035 RepID=A0A0R3MLX6_9BRAD|nr:hypothetical protein [Bradyrhizobium retamae]KRR21220.1 hypothetical protein CQ13_30905 [Bradyrhizobium retamae]
MMVTSEPPTLALLEDSDAMMLSGTPVPKRAEEARGLLRLVAGQHIGGAATDRRQHADQNADDRRPQQEEWMAEDFADHLEVGNPETRPHGQRGLGLLWHSYLVARRQDFAKNEEG